MSEENIEVLNTEDVEINREEVYKDYQKEIDDLVNSIENADVDDISTIGMDEMNNATGPSDDYLNSITVGNVDGDIQNIISNAVNSCKTSMDTNKKGLFNFIKGKVKDKVDDIKLQYTTLNTVLENVKTNIDFKKNDLISSRKAGEAILRSMGEMVNKFDILIASLEIARERMISKISETDRKKSLIFSEGVAFKLEILEKRLEDIKFTKHAMLTNAVFMNRGISDFKRAEIDIDSIMFKLNTTWKNNFIMRINSLKTKEIVNLSRTIGEQTEDLMITTAREISKNSSDIFKMNSNSLIKIDTLKDIQKTMFEMLENINTQNKQLTDNRAKNNIELENLLKQQDKLNIEFNQSFVPKLGSK